MACEALAIASILLMCRAALQWLPGEMAILGNDVAREEAYRCTHDCLCWCQS
jgi:hypothetical protein